MNALLSDNVGAIAGAIQAAIDADTVSMAKTKARVGVGYYEGKHDILHNRIFYIDDNDNIKEDTFASNIRIPHQFHTEMVDQKAQYLLTNQVEHEVEDETFKDYLEEYYDEDFQVFLKEMVEGASCKGFDYAFARTTTEDRLAFQNADMLQTIPIYDDEYVLRRMLYWWDEDIIKEGRTVHVVHAQIWDETQVWFFRSDDRRAFVFDTSVAPNPRPHVIAQAEDGTFVGRSYGSIPFHKLKNNKSERTDLEPVKALIDDYDIMNCFLSNNLQDFAEAIYVVSGFQGDDFSKLRQNVKSRKVVGVGSGGTVDVKTVTIPVEGRKAKMEIDKENIYKFGMGFDSTQVGDGNITNIVIKARYTLLDMKASKIESYLRSLLKWCNQLVTEDINRRHGTAYKAEDVKFTIEPEVMANESDLANIELVEAQTKKTLIEAILSAAPKLDDDSILQLICEQFDLDWEEVKEQLETQEYTPGLAEGTDPEASPQPGDPANNNLAGLPAVPPAPNVGGIGNAGA
jgi:SPP1 family phage portal protein